MNPQTPSISNQSMAIKLLIAVAAQVIIVFLLISYNAAIIAGGQTVYVSVLPVDPSDPLRGDYVTNRLTISTAYPSQFSSAPQDGETVYVPVKQLSKTDVYISGQIVKNESEEGMGLDRLPHSVPEGTIYIKGTVSSGGSRAATDPMADPYGYGGYPSTSPNFAPVSYDANGNVIPQKPMFNEYMPVTIKYGVEEKFVQKGSGNLPFNKQVVAELKVGDGGVARITKLFVDGKEMK